MPLGPGVCLEQLAHRLRGYTGADVAAVCTEAALRCASEAVAAAESAAGGADGMAEEDLSQHLASPKFLASLRVEGRHFEAAVGQLGPAVLRGLSPEVPEVRWEDVGGLQVGGGSSPAFVPRPPRLRPLRLRLLRARHLTSLAKQRKLPDKPSARQTNTEGFSHAPPPSPFCRRPRLRCESWWISR